MCWNSANVASPLSMNRFGVPCCWSAIVVLSGIALGHREPGVWFLFTVRTSLDAFHQLELWAVAEDAQVDRAPIWMVFDRDDTNDDRRPSNAVLVAITNELAGLGPAHARFNA